MFRFSGAQRWKTRRSVKEPRFASWLERCCVVVVCGASLLSLSIAVVPCRVWAQEAETKAEAKAPDPYRAALKRFADQSKGDPQGAVENALAFLGAHSGNSKNTRSSVAKLYRGVALLQMVKLHDVDAALSTVAQGEKTLGDQVPSPGYFLTVKSEILVRADRLDETEALLSPAFESFSQTKPAVARELLGYYTTLLKRQNKHERALEVVQEFVADNPAFTNDLGLIEQMTQRLLMTKRTDEALGWAKLYWMLAPYQEAGLSDATSLLIDVWTAKFLTPVKAQELVAAMQDESTPNPLSAVALPTIERAAMQKQAAGARKAPDRIGYLLLSGDDRAAMIEAQKLVLNNPTSPEGALQVCRVFKAHDLNVNRADGFLTYYNMGKGENPVTAFLKE